VDPKSEQACKIQLSQTKMQNKIKTTELNQLTPTRISHNMLKEKKIPCVAKPVL